MQGDIASSVLLPAILAFIMFALGLGLTSEDFRRIARQPKALVVGAFCHFVLLPVVCFLMLKTLGLTGAFAVGFMILAACPTGSTSNLLTYIARGDVALALSFTAVASVLTIVTLPFVVAWSLAHFVGTSQAVAVPVGSMMGQVFLLVGVPVVLGMAARRRWPDRARAFEPKATRIATVLFVAIVLIAVAKNWTLLADNFTTLAPFAIVLNLAMLTLGFLVAWLARLSRRQAVTLGIETAIQNATLALVIASSVLGNDAMAIPGAVYGVLMYAGGLAFAYGVRRLVEPDGGPALPDRAAACRRALAGALTRRAASAQIAGLSSTRRPMANKPPRNPARFGERTRLVHAGRDPSQQHGFVNTPIYRGSTVLYPSADDFTHRRAKYTYGTKGSPTIEGLESAWSDISKAAGTVLAPSGLGAIALALFSCLKAGDHLLVTDSVYLPTRHFCEGMLKKFGVETTYYDPALGADITSLFRPNTRAVFTESPGSLSFEMQDVPAIAEAAASIGATVLIDNTWATPLFFSPHEKGADLVIEAGTKYLSGGSDLLLGMVSAKETHWPALRRTFDQMSMCAGPEDVFLAMRGLRTMAVRLREHERQALEVARWLAERPEVARVLHPALESCPGHALWKRDFTGSSGLFSIILKPAPNESVAAMLDGLELFGIGASWGGFESLIVPFDCTSFRTVTQWAPGGPALRLHIGLEDLDDLKRDLDQGFARLAAHGG